MLKQRARQLKNALWIVAEKLLAVLGLIFVTSLVAKYVGPTTFGIIALSMLIFQFIQSVAIMGSDVVILKRVAQNERSGIRLMQSTFMLVLLLYGVLSLATAAILGARWSAEAWVFVLAACLACLFSALDLVNVYNEAKLNARINVVANIIGLSISLLIRFIISSYALPASYLALPIVLATLLPFSIKLIVFRHQHRPGSLPALRNVKRYTRYMLKSGSSLVLSSIAVALYTRLNQVSVSWFMGIREAGIFSVALTLSTAWVFLPNALLASFYPAFFAEKDPLLARIKVQKLHLLVIAVSLTVIAMIYYFSPWFIRYFYGEEYADSASAVFYLSFGAMFGVLSGITDRFIIKYNGYRYLIKKTFAVLIICIISSGALVPAFGLSGAALSVIITELFSFTVLNYFFTTQSVLRVHAVFYNPRVLWQRVKRTGVNPQ